MRKNSSHSPRDSRPGANSSFGKKSGGRPAGKDAKPFKKNYDGKGPSSGGSDRPSRPYSGRSADGPAGRSERGSFGKDSRPRKDDGARKPFERSSRPFEDRRPRTEGEGKPYDKPKRSYGDKDGSAGRPPFAKGEGKKWEDRKPRGDGDSKPYDKPKRPYADRGESTGRPSFAKGEGKKWEDRKPRGDGDSKPYDKPKRPYADRGESAGRPPFAKGEGKKWEDRKPRGDGDSKPYDKPKRPYADRGEAGDRRGGEKGAYKKWEEGGKPRGAGDDRPKRSYSKDDSRDERKPRASADSRPFRDRPKPAAGKKAGFEKPGFDKHEKDAPEADPRTFDKVMKNAFNPPKKKREENDGDPAKPVIHEDQVFGELEEVVKEKKIKTLPIQREGKPEIKKVTTAFTKKKRIHDHSEGRKKKYDDEDEEDEDDVKESDGMMPLNKFIAHSGECSRRDAAELVKQGKVKVNGELILEPGHKVHVDANVTLVGKKLKPTKDNVYILLNKPKGFITTNEDPQGRKTVMQLVANSGAERLFPVGRLDRDTSGLLLITNDGDLTQRLCHPSYDIKKVYHVTLDKALTKADFEKIVAGVELEDGKAIVDEIAYLESKNELGLEIHSGRNRIVRRIFESLGYVVDKLDRMMYAGLTKKNLPRGKWRHLDPREVVLLKHFKS